MKKQSGKKKAEKKRPGEHAPSKQGKRDRERSDEREREREREREKESTFKSRQFEGQNNAKTDQKK